jgi:hypothetical protein
MALLKVIDAEQPIYSIDENTQRRLSFDTCQLGFSSGYLYFRVYKKNSHLGMLVMLICFVVIDGNLKVSNPVIWLYFYQP